MRLQGLVRWQVLDVPKMIGATQDPRGDVWNKARNSIIQAVSQVTLSQFMNNLNQIVTDAIELDTKPKTDGNDTIPTFYDERGITLHGMEITSYDCVDEETAAVLQLIIRETTNRINRLQQQESENDIKEAKLDADIQLEAMKTELLTTQVKNEFLVENTKLDENIKLEKLRAGFLTGQADNAKLIALGEGEAAGLQLAKTATAFFGDFGINITGDINTTIALYKLHQEYDNRKRTTKNLATAKTSIFVTPEQVNLDLSDN